LSAVRTAARDVGPLIPGASEPRLSFWLCCVRSGSGDQNNSTNGFPLLMKPGRITFVTESVSDR
jgi:hypothetical protein